MEIDLETYKKLIAAVFKNFKMLESELMAYRLAFVAMKTVDPDSDLDQFLERARSSAALRQQMIQKYDAPVEKLLKQVHQAAVDQELLELLRSWNPTGHTN